MLIVKTDKELNKLMIVTQVFGEFYEALPPSQKFLLISFSPISMLLKQQWRNNGLSRLILLLIT